MKLVKSLLLGSAAGLVAVAGASAADLGVKKPTAVEYVKTCPQYGAGFFVVPGTTSCLKIIGRVRADYIANNFARSNGLAPGAQGRSIDRTTFRARGYFGYDHRTATEYGLLRTYVRGFVGRDNAATGTTLEYAFIQFGGLTAGRITPVFEHGWSNLYNGSGSFGGYSDISYVNSLGYTFQFGGGFSATLAIDAANERVVGVGYNGTRTTFPAGGGAGVVAARTFDTGAQGGQRMPDIVAALDYSSSWGSVKLAGALHEVNTSGLVNRASVRPDGSIRVDSGNNVANSRIGYALTAAAKINLPMISAGSNFWVNGTYAEGAVSYAGFGSTPSTIGGVENTWNDAQLVGTSLRLTKAWALAGGLEVFAAPTVRLGLYGTYASIDRFGPGNTINTYSVWGQAAWLPVSGFQIGAEVGYVGARYGQALKAGLAGLNKDHWTGRLRFQRDF
jgi:hypothetical protein